jgi:hypothetical protein
MVFFIAFVAIFMLWPRFILYFLAAPFLGAILGGFTWVMAMFLTGFSIPLSSIGSFVIGGMALSTFYAIFWANKEKL